MWNVKSEVEVVRVLSFGSESEIYLMGRRETRDRRWRRKDES